MSIADSLSPTSVRIWDDKYRFKAPDGTPIDTTIEDTWKRVARALAAPEKESIRADWGRAFELVLRDFQFLPAGRILAGAGTGRRVTLMNCYVNGTIDDDLGAIFEHLREAALTMQQGGGIGYDFSTLRPKGTPLKRTGSTASGPLPFMGTWDAMCKTIMSAGTRRGAMMGVMRCDHPDIEEFIDAKRDARRFRNFNLSVLITAPFLEARRLDAPWALKFGDTVYKTIFARELWDRIMRATYDVAEPGVIFIDRINEQNPLNYCESIQATNPCFTGDTRVWTASGPRRFDELAKSGKPVLVLTELADGKLAYRTMTNPRVTRRGADDVVRVTLESRRGMRGARRVITAVTATATHKVFLSDGSRRRVADLAPGDSIESVYRGAANQKGYIKLRATSGDEVMEHHVAVEVTAGQRPKWPEEHAHHVNGKSDNSPGNIRIVAASDHNSEHMTGDGNPMRKWWTTTTPEEKARYHENMSASQSGEKNGMAGRQHSPETLAKIGAKTRERFNDPAFREKHSAGVRNANHKVVSVEKVPGAYDVYCGTVKDTGRFFIVVDDKASEGILVSNCGEQPLPPYGSCLLGSINLAKFVKHPFTDNASINFPELSAVAAIATRMMDNVIDVTEYPLEEQRQEATLKRRIGLGVTGLADALLMLGVRYGSETAKSLAFSMMKDVHLTAYRTSIELADQKGSFPLFDFKQYVNGPAGKQTLQYLPSEYLGRLKKDGIRNGLLTSIAPTGTISLFADNVSSGVEPIFAGSYTRKVLQPDGSKREETVVDYALKEWLKLDRSGAFPPAFVTAESLTPAEHVAMQGAVQTWVDSAVSKTCNVPKDIAFEDFKQVYLDAYDAGCKGITTYRPNDVTGSVLSVKPEAPKAEPKPIETGETPIVVDDAPPPRPVELTGKTYKLRWPTSEHAFYLTVNDIEENGEVRPYEVFINSKNLEHYPWVIALTRMISAVYRRGGPIDFVAEELQQVFDPKGGTWADGKYVSSFVAAIGQALADHRAAYGMGGMTPDAPAKPPAEPSPVNLAGKTCPACSKPTLFSSGGCLNCLSCSYSKCE